MLDSRHESLEACSVPGVAVVLLTVSAETRSAQSTRADNQRGALRKLRVDFLISLSISSNRYGFRPRGTRDVQADVVSFVSSAAAMNQKRKAGVFPKPSGAVMPTGISSNWDESLAERSHDAGSNPVIGIRYA